MLPVSSRWAFNQHFLSVAVLPVVSIYRPFPPRLLVSATQGRVSVTRLSTLQSNVYLRAEAAHTSVFFCHALWLMYCVTAPCSRTLGLSTFTQVLLFSLVSKWEVFFFYLLQVFFSFSLFPFTQTYYTWYYMLYIIFWIYIWHCERDTERESGKILQK